MSRGLEERGEGNKAHEGKGGGRCGGGKKAQREGIGHRRVWEKGKRGEDMSGSAGERGGGRERVQQRGFRIWRGLGEKEGRRKCRDVGHVGVSGRGGREQSTGGVQGSGGGD